MLRIPSKPTPAPGKGKGCSHGETVSDGAGDRDNRRWKITKDLKCGFTQCPQYLINNPFISITEGLYLYN